MTKQLRGQERRAQILEVANRLFRSQGYSGTSMRQIAREAGFGEAVSGLYNHFPSKEALFAALLKHRSPYEELLAKLDEVRGGTVSEFLRNWLGAVWPIMQDHLDFIQLVFIDLQEFDGRTLGSFVAELLPRFYALFSRIRALPDVRDDLSPPVLIRTIASVMIGFIMTEMVVQHTPLEQLPFPLALDEVWLDGLVAILARGMSKPETVL